VSTDFDTGVEFDQIVTGAQPEPARRGRGRPRNSTPVAPAPAGLTFTEFEADMLADELEDRAADILRDNAEDKYLKRRAQFLKDTAKAVRDQPKN